MRRFAIIIFLTTFAIAVNEALELAKPCDEEKCKLPACKCSTTDSGNEIPISKTPQIVMLTFDDAVTGVTYDRISKALFGLKNPDGCPIGVTHFVSHEWTDYSKVHSLWINGHEIALHSVTHSTEEDYWLNITLEKMESEFGDERKIMGRFAGIPESDIRGIRLPFLQFGGNVTLEGLQSLGLLYDSSMPSLGFRNPALWPYTFEYESEQECIVPPCADASFPGIWEVPMTVWDDQKDIPCNMVDACVNVPNKEGPLFEWMVGQFERHYKGSRAPFPVFMHAAWFLRSEENYKAYKKFIGHLQSLPDVYLVTVNKAIEWIKHPEPISNPKPFGNCETRVPQKACRPITCRLLTSTGEPRYVTSCVAKCPKTYPWLGNPYGL